MSDPVFAHADRLFALLGRLVCRPAKGELPREVPDRDGIPVLSLVGDQQAGLADQIGKALSGADPRHVPHEFVDIDQMWTTLITERRDLTLDWRRAELCRRMLVDLAKEFSSARYGRDQPRFRRFGLVNWLLEMTYENPEPNSRHAQDVLRRLRGREIERRRIFGFMRSPATEVSLQGQVPWWAYLFGLHVLPLLWFRAWRALGSEYRWLLRQPYMAPADPGTFEGFALRLTQPRWGREDPGQVIKLMINAFLEDLRVAYRRRPWRRRAYRRVAYCVAYLKGVNASNNGWALVRSLVEVRNETGAFDPLLLVTSSRENEHHHERVRDLTGDLGLYEAWCEHLRSAGRSREADFWYLPVRVRPPLESPGPDRDEQWERTSAARRIVVGNPPFWARRRATVGAAILALVLLAGGGASAISAEQEWRERHCGLSRSHPDARTLVRQTGGECFGVAPHGYAFGATDERLVETLQTIASQNDEADRAHRVAPTRPVVTLIYLSALLGSVAGDDSDTVSYVREQLQGAAVAQRRQLDEGANNPLLRIFPASAGAGMEFGEEAARIIGEMTRSDPTIVGVVGLDQSRSATIDTINALTRVGLPMVATTLSADSLHEESPLYYQVSPQNRREAAVAAAYAAELADHGPLRERSVRILYSADTSDQYSSTLWADAVEAFRSFDFEVESQAFEPTVTGPGTSEPGPRTVGEATCGHQGLVFFAGRSEDFASVLSGANYACGSTPPRFLAGDDVARLAADVDRRDDFLRVPYEFLDFTMGSASCDTPGSDLYGTMATLFRDACEEAENTSLAGDAALAFDAVSVYLKAVDQLLERADGMPLTAAAVWQAISRIHGGAALDGESGFVDFGGEVGRQIPLDKLISIQRVDGRVDQNAPVTRVAFCGRVGSEVEEAWCPEPEAG
ncbi:hypothetical protein [Streptomyces mayteni]